jgi:hypothetical protein
MDCLSKMMTFGYGSHLFSVFRLEQFLAITSLISLVPSPMVTGGHPIDTLDRYSLE